MSKIDKVILNIILAIIVFIVGVQIGLNKHKDQIDYRQASFIYNEEILHYKELVMTLDDYQLQKYHDTLLVGENIRSKIDCFEEQLDSIYSVNKPF